MKFQAKQHGQELRPYRSVAQSGTTSSKLDQAITYQPPGIVSQQKVQTPNRNTDAPIQRYIRAGYIPGGWTYPTGRNYYSEDAYTVRNPDGGDDFSQPRKVDKVNRDYASSQTLTFPPVRKQMSDYSNLGLIYIEDSSKLAPEVDHIVEKRYGGANDLRNARVLSKKENTDNSANRPTSKQLIAGNKIKVAEVKYNAWLDLYTETGMSRTIANKAVMNDTDLKVLLAVYHKHAPDNNDVTSFNYGVSHLNRIRNLSVGDINTSFAIHDNKYLKVKSVS